MLTYLHTHPIGRLILSTRERQGGTRWRRIDVGVPLLLLVLLTPLLLALARSDLDSYAPFRTRLIPILLMLYWVVMVRLTCEGVSVSRALSPMESLLPVLPLRTRWVVFALWGSAIYRMRAWCLLLVYCWSMGMGAELLLLPINSINDALTFYGQFIVLIGLIGLFSLINVICAVSVGAALGLLFRRVSTGVAIGVALGVLGLREGITLGLWLLELPGYLGVSLSFITDRFDFYTLAPVVAALSDGGLLALNRLLYLFWPRGLVSHFWAYGWIAVILTLCVPVLLIGLSTVLTITRLHPLNGVILFERRAARHGAVVVVPLIVFSAACIALVLLWTHTPRVPLTLAIPPFPYISRDWLRIAQGVLAGVLTVVTVRALTAGVGLRLTAGNAAVNLRQIWDTVAELRGWIFGLTLLLLTLFILLYLDHVLNAFSLSGLAALEGYWWEWGARERHKFAPFYDWFQWDPLQFFAAGGWAILMSYALVGSGVVLGTLARLVWRRYWLAWVGAVTLRAIPVLIGLLPPNVITLPHPGLLVTRFSADPLFTLADGGLTVLIGLAEPGWTAEDHCGRTLVSFAVVLGTFTLIGLLLLAVSPLFIQWLSRRWPAPDRSQR